MWRKKNLRRIDSSFIPRVDLEQLRQQFARFLLLLFQRRRGMKWEKRSGERAYVRGKKPLGQEFEFQTSCIHPSDNDDEPTAEKRTNVRPRNLVSVVKPRVRRAKKEVMKKNSWNSELIFFFLPSSVRCQNAGFLTTHTHTHTKKDTRESIESAAYKYFRRATIFTIKIAPFGHEIEGRRRRKKRGKNLCSPASHSAFGFSEFSQLVSFFFDSDPTEREEDLFAVRNDWHLFV